MVDRTLIVLGFLWLGAGCGQTSAQSEAGGAGAPAGGAGSPPMAQGGAGAAGALAGGGGAKPAAAGAGGAAITTGGSGGSAGQAAGGATPANGCEPKKDQPPGEAVTDLAAVGSEDCAGVTLAEVIEQVRALRPDLSDVKILYAPDPDQFGDGSFIHAFRQSDGGFALAFKRGRGDCPAGCIQNDYWYFETGADCQVEAKGEAHRPVDGACVPTDQLPRWGLPQSPLPSAICGADLSPANLTGDYEVVSCGKLMPCATSKDAGAEQPLPSTLSLSITQDASDLGQGTVTLNGTGEPLLDGKSFPATFQGRAFKVSAEYSNLPSTCPEQWSLAWEYDFDGAGSRHLELQHMKTPDCAGNPNDYCKGYIATKLGNAVAKP